MIFDFNGFFKMAQLDKYIFLTQILWFVLFFIGFYFLMLKFLFPFLFFMIRVRVLRLQELKTHTLPEDRKQQNEIVLTSLSNSLTSLFNFSISLFSQIKDYSYSLSLKEINRWNNLVILNQKKNISFFNVLDKFVLKYNFYLINWILNNK